MAWAESFDSKIVPVISIGDFPNEKDLLGEMNAKPNIACNRRRHRNFTKNIRL